MANTTVVRGFLGKPVRVLKSYKKSAAGKVYSCLTCKQDVVAGQRYYEWSQGGVMVQTHESHGVPNRGLIKNGDRFKLLSSDICRVAAESQGMGERNDCTVRALAIATGAPYPTAHEFMRIHGRKAGQGAFSERSYPHFSYEGMKLEMRRTMYRASGLPTINQLLQELPKGRFIFKVPRHVFAVIDGKIHDGHVTGGRTRVHCYFEVVPSATKS